MSVERNNKSWLKKFLLKHAQYFMICEPILSFFNTMGIRKSEFSGIQMIKLNLVVGCSIFDPECLTLRHVWTMAGNQDPCVRYTIILAILDHYLSISKVLDLISRQIPTIYLTKVLTRVIAESASFWRIGITGRVIPRLLLLMSYPKIPQLLDLVNDSLFAISFNKNNWLN